MLQRVACVLALVSIGSLAHAEPFVPTDDSLVVLRVALPFGQERFRELESAVRAHPADASAVQRLADAYLEIGRRTGEPRYFGRAEAALAPWLDAPRPPVALALQMADIRQYRHEYDAALLLVDRVLEREPREPRALLMRAAIHLTRGRFEMARADCRMLLARGETMLGTTCLAQVMSMTGSLVAAERLLTALVERSAQLPAVQRGWMMTTLAEEQERSGRAESAERYLRQALELDAHHHYARLALADLLLDRGRAEEIPDLLAGMPKTEGVLLRLAEAQQRSGPARANSDVLRARIAEASRRGERLHRRDLVRLHLRVLGDERAALAHARDNWAEQREPVDARLLAEAALAARDVASLQELKDWRVQTGYEDQVLDQLLRDAGHGS